MRRRAFRNLLVAATVLTIPTVTVFAAGAWYHGIRIDYQATSIAHFGGAWLSVGDIESAQNVDQIGSTFWSTVETCDGQYMWESFYSFNGRMNYNWHSYSDDIFRSNYGVEQGYCAPGQVNKLRTYIRFYIQDYPYAGKEYVSTDWATW